MPTPLFFPGSVIWANSLSLKLSVTCDSNRIKGILEMEELYNLCEDILNNRRGKLGNKVRVVSKKVNRSKQPKRDGSQD